jgi:hypothetical protein
MGSELRSLQNVISNQKTGIEIEEERIQGLRNLESLIYTWRILVVEFFSQIIQCDLEKKKRQFIYQ